MAAKQQRPQDCFGQPTPGPPMINAARATAGQHGRYELRQQPLATHYGIPVTHVITCRVSSSSIAHPTMSSSPSRSTCDLHLACDLKLLGTGMCKSRALTLHHFRWIWASAARASGATQEPATLATPSCHHARADSPSPPSLFLHTPLQAH